MKKHSASCLKCGGELVWDRAEMAADVYADYEGDEVAIVDFYHCLRCGCSYELVDPNEEERSGSYKEYWDKVG